MICYLLSRSLYMDISLPVCGGVFRKFLKISSTYIGNFSSLCGGVSLNIFKNPSTIIGNLPCPLAGCFKKFTVIYYPSTIIGNFRHESKWFARNFFLTEENLLTIYDHLHIVWRGVFGKN